MRTPHTSAPKGKMVRILLDNGVEIIDKFKERLSRFVVTENHKIPSRNIKSLSIVKNLTRRTM
jgi:hypothetical protein